MGRKTWDDLREDFARVAFEHGVSNAARMIPCSRSSAYRLLNGEVGHPSQAIRAGVERVVDQVDSQVGQSGSTQD